MRLSAAIAAPVSGPDPDVAGISADSRHVRRGFIFAALPGTKTDGAAFIPAAVEKGAVAVLAGPAAQGKLPDGMPWIQDTHPRARLAQIAARLAGAQPKTVCAVTGTNGKTSTAQFTRQIFAKLGQSSASLGTVGVTTATHHRPLSHTTPDPVELHRILAELAGEGITHLALEASSHGLEQNRLDGIRISAAAFTNLTRDHLDYHPTFEDYAHAKLRLFGDLLPPGAPAVVWMDAPHAEDFANLARARGHRLLKVGTEPGCDLRLRRVTPDGHGQLLELSWTGRDTKVALPLAGTFQAANALVSAAFALALECSAAQVFAALETLQGASGRLEHVATSATGAPVLVDYAHTPDAVETVLKSVRPHVTGRLIIVLGCGGDRDPGKRPLMGAAAERHADIVIVTDDNPRSEDPALIRKAVLAAAPKATEIGDRHLAIRHAVSLLKAGDALIIAGKGHETGQIIGKEVRPFNDTAEARAAVRDAGGQAVGGHT